MIGPVTTGSAQRSTTPGAGSSVGPQIPAGYAVKEPAEDEEEDEEDDYVPELPPDLVAQRATQKARVLGPSLPSAVQNSYDDSDDDDVGPMPLPAYLSSQHQEKSGVEEFLEREKRRKQAMEVCVLAHALFTGSQAYYILGCCETEGPQARRVDVGASIEVRFAQMYVQLASCDRSSGWLTPVHIEIAIDPTRMNKPRKFAPTTNPNAGSTDTTLWTETPAERQQRLADELAGKKRRKENSDIPDDHGLGVPESLKRQRIDNEVRRAVADHNVCGIVVSPLVLTHVYSQRKNRPESLLQMHAKKHETPQPKTEKDEAIWDHSRDMALSGHLLDEKSRSKIIADSAGLSDRFGSSKFA